jgi:hypothetical protein
MPVPLLQIERAANNGSLRFERRLGYVEPSKVKTRFTSKSEQGCRLPSLASVSSCPELQIAKVPLRCPVQGMHDFQSAFHAISLGFEMELLSSERPALPRIPRRYSKPWIKSEAPAGGVLTGIPPERRSSLRDLADLRRAGRDSEVYGSPCPGEVSPSSGAAESAGRPGDAIKSEPMLEMTLSDETDTEDILIARLTEMQAAHKNCKGNMHATVHYQERTMAIVEGKCRRLQTLKQKLQAYEAASRNPEEVIQSLDKGDDAMLSDNAFGLGTHLAKCVHNGRLEDAEKGEFKHFVETFGLPEKHWLVAQARKTLDSVRDKWIECVKQNIAKKVTAAEQNGTGWEASLHSLESGAKLLLVVGVKSHHPALAEIRNLKVRIAKKSAEEEGLRKRQQNAEKNRKEAELRARAAAQRDMS